MSSDIPQFGFTGVIRDDEFPDERDEVGGLEEAVRRIDPTSLPDELNADREDLAFFSGLVLNQGQKPICAGCAGRTALFIWERMDESLPRVRANEDTLYAMSRVRFEKDFEALFAAAGKDLPVGGTTPRSLMQVLHKDLGAVVRYVRVDPTVDQELLIGGLKALLVLRQAVPVVLKNIAWNQSGILEISQDGGQLQHLVCFTGYSRGGFLFPNSWGRGWGDVGLGFLPFGIVSAQTIDSGWGITPRMTLPNS